jgi:hypothetical protein
MYAYANRFSKLHELSHGILKLSIKILKKKLLFDAHKTDLKLTKFLHQVQPVGCLNF